MKRNRILIYRLGSLGDTLVALPVFHLIARTFPHSQRYVLTNASTTQKAAPMASILEGTGLVHGFLEYPLGLRNIRTILALRTRIMEQEFDALVYLAESRGRFRAWRDAAFFYACGIHELIGVPYTQREHQPVRLPSGLYESKTSALNRRLANLGATESDVAASNALNLSAVEHTAASDILAPLKGRNLIAISVGAKVDVKDWEDLRWRPMLTQLASQYPNHGLVAIGSSDEAARCEALCSAWNGRFINACGHLSIRMSASVLARCSVFIGHDSGPMHLAATVNTPCVAIFSSRNLPGEWFPVGVGHQILYRSMSCQGCRLDICEDKQKACIRSFSVGDVLKAVESVISRTASVDESLIRPKQLGS